MPSDKPKPIDFLAEEPRATAERRYFWLLVWLHAGSAAVFLAFMAVLHAAAPSGGADVIVLTSTSIVLGVIAINYGLFAWLNRRGVWWAQPSPLLALRFKDRRRLVHALRRDDPVPDDINTTVAHACMRWFARMRSYLLITPALAGAALVLNLVVAPTLFLKVYNAALLIFVAVMVVWRNRPVTRNSRSRLANSAEAPL